MGKNLVVILQIFSLQNTKYMFKILQFMQTSDTPSLLKTRHTVSLFKVS